MLLLRHLKRDMFNEFPEIVKLLIRLVVIACPMSDLLFDKTPIQPIQWARCSFSNGRLLSTVKILKSLLADSIQSINKSLVNVNVIIKSNLHIVQGVICGPILRSDVMTSSRLILFTDFAQTPMNG